MIRGAVERKGARARVHYGGIVYDLDPGGRGGAHAHGHEASPSELYAPMTGTIVQVIAKEGDAVTRGGLILVVEAMKMEHRVVAPADATVSAVHVKAGDRVDVGAKLVSLKPEGRP
jgi:biotin carboxyl carrier protein